MQKLNKTDLIDAIASQTGDAKTDIERTVNAAFDTMTAALKDGKKVSILSFGNFTPKTSKARTGRNPRTGEPVEIAAKNGVGFKPTKALSDALNG